MRTRATLLALLALVLLAGPAWSQVTGRLDAGVAGGPQDGQSMVAGWSVAPALGYQTARLRLLMDGQYEDRGHFGRGFVANVSGSHFIQLAQRSSMISQVS